MKRLFRPELAGAALQVTVARQACCSADDQAGPLEAVYALHEEAILADLVERIQASKFLQFSSTHNRLSGEVDGVCVVEVFAGWGRGPQFHADPAERVAPLMAGRPLCFHFRHA